MSAETEKVAANEDLAKRPRRSSASAYRGQRDGQLGELPTITADRVQLRQVLQNLIANGMKYCSDRPPVSTFGCRRRTGLAEFGYG